MCFREKVQEALVDTRPAVSHQEVMAQARALVSKKKHRAGS
ncbi:hypothetical protein [Achromobacter sp. ES-001]